IAPGRIMRRQLMRSRRIAVTVDLRQDHVRWIGLILDNVETQNARLPQRRGQEIPDPSRPDPRMNMDYKHVLILLHNAHPRTLPDHTIPDGRADDPVLCGWRQAGAECQLRRHVPPGPATARTHARGLALWP